MGALGHGQRLIIGLAVVATTVSAVLALGGANSILVFAVTAATLALLATLVGTGTEQVGERLGPGATGVLQASLGNLPELFISIFALRAGLASVVQAALVGSILANSLLVLGLAFLLGGLRHGTQHFASAPARMIAILTVLTVAVLAVPSLARVLHTPAAAHADELSAFSAVVLLLVFAFSLRHSLVADTGRDGVPSVGHTGTGADADAGTQPWPLALAGAVLAGAALAAALVSDWFVTALTPAATALHIAPTFTGLVVVALAGNAVENVVGVRLALRNRADYALSVILNSSLQVALALTPLLVLLSFVLGGAHLTLVLPPLLIVALGATAVMVALIVVDGESNALEGAVLIGFYAVIAASFWWG